MPLSSRAFLIYNTCAQKSGRKLLVGCRTEWDKDGVYSGKVRMLSGLSVYGISQKAFALFAELAQAHKAYGIVFCLEARSKAYADVIVGKAVK